MEEGEGVSLGLANDERRGSGAAAPTPPRARPRTLLPFTNDTPTLGGAVLVSSAYFGLPRFLSFFFRF